MLKTPLFDCHLSANAKMVDFSGWNMPINYGSQLQEHNCVRNNCGIFDVSHMLGVDIYGSQAEEFLRHVLACDVVKLKVNSAQYGCMLNHDAGIIDDLITYRVGSDSFRIVINAGNRESDVAWFRENSKNFDVMLSTLENLAIVAVQGPNAVEVVSKSVPCNISAEVKSLKPFTFKQSGDWFFARTGYTGEDGFEIMMPGNEAVDFWNKILSNGGEPVGLGARDTLRLEAGMHLYGSDMNDSTTPLERGLGWSVDLSDETRDFIGKKRYLELKTQGVSTKWAGVVLREKGILRSGQEISFDNGSIGYITSGSFSPTLGLAIGLAYIPKVGSNPQVNIRKKLLEIEVVKPRFVKNNKSLI